MKIKTIYDQGFLKPLQPLDIPNDATVIIQIVEVIPYDPAPVIQVMQRLASIPPQNLTPICEEDHDRIIYMEHYERGLRGE